MSTMETPGAAGALEQTTSAYTLQGTLLETCSCDVVCPCWVGEDPDGGVCQTVVAYHFDKGEISGVDVGGLTMVLVAQIPGNIFVPKSWKLLVLMDEKATPEQQQAILDAYTGKLGGPLADIAALIGEVLGIERVPIVHEVRGGHGELHAGTYVTAVMEPYRGPDGSTTTLRDSVFSTIPGSPAYVSKASQHQVEIPQYGIKWTFQGRNAVQGDYNLAFP